MRWEKFTFASNGAKFSYSFYLYIKDNLLLLKWLREKS